MKSKQNHQRMENVIESFCRKLIHAVPDGSDSDVHPTVISTVEQILLRVAMEECEGSQIAVGRLLGLHRNTVRRKLQQYNLQY